MTCRGPVVTQRQLEVLDFVDGFTASNGYPPGYRDFMAHFGWTSTNAARDHLRAMATKRLVGWTPRIARSVHLTASGESALRTYRRALKAAAEAPKP